MATIFKVLVPGAVFILAGCSNQMNSKIEYIALPKQQRREPGLWLHHLSDSVIGFEKNIGKPTSLFHGFVVEGDGPEKPGWPLRDGKAVIAYYQKKYKNERVKGIWLTLASPAMYDLLEVSTREKMISMCIANSIPVYVYDSSSKEQVWRIVKTPQLPS